jgi:hypothetical protein
MCKRSVELCYIMKMIWFCQVADMTTKCLSATYHLFTFPQMVMVIFL